MNTIVRNFLKLALLMLVLGIFFGVIGGLQYVFPAWLKENLPFTKIRPLHVTLVISWIFTASTAGIYYYFPMATGRKIFFEPVARLHFIILLLSTVITCICYFNGKFGGREYLEFPPLLALPVILYWLLFTFNYFRSSGKEIIHAPVYVWMWTTGIIFFLFTIIESYLWLIPWFKENLVRDVTVQWKAMGSMVGSWNMLVYGTAFFIMEKISGNDKVTRSPATFFFYFLSLTNLMFNWGHHTYIVPASPWIKNISYFISMTELLILGNIIFFWRHSLSKAKRNFHILSYRFLSIADAWIFLNLVLAIIISVPEINYYTHGTHITVAHAMGTTIGINTMILFASFFFIADQELVSPKGFRLKIIRSGFWIVNGSLFLFWLSLIGSGVVKAIEKERNTSFQQTMMNLSPWFHAFLIAGIAVFMGICMIAFPLFKMISKIKL
jgi:nitric oxide reductase subunit B